MIGRVRAQLEDYYKTLTEEKAREERRSLWRIQRMKLNRLRRAHLTLEQNNLNTEMRKRLQRKDVALPAVSADPDVALSAVKADPDVALPDSQTTGDTTADSSEEAGAMNEAGDEGDEEKGGKEDVDEEKEGEEGPSSDGDSEISFTVSPEQSESRQYEPDGQMKDILYGKSADPSHAVAEPSQNTTAPDGQMKDLLYGNPAEPSHAEHGQPEHMASHVASHVITAYEPEGQMKDLLYGDADARKETERENATTPTETERENATTPAETESENVKTPTETETIKGFEPAGTMKDILYGGAGAKSAAPKTRQYEREGNYIILYIILYIIYYTLYYTLYYAIMSHLKVT